MTDKLSPERRSRNMAAIRSGGMKPEMIVRRLAHAMGFRYRLHRKDLPGKPDLVFGPRRKVIFVHGCFWHQHSDPACKIARRPKSNGGYWAPKLERNVQRDAENQAALENAGWRVLTIWECETKDMDTLAQRIRAFLAP
ncbi:MAG: DNA mismatch endonuclease Vsr [Alphaproteobacteria bacterium]|nr:DNA mismatch endonuclease Vsr [Alphaproteobacteria bacterium]